MRRTSPIVVAVQEVVGQLRSQWGCSTSSPCTLWVRTDGLETVDRAVVRALSTPPAEIVLEPIDVAGIDVHVCGLGATSEPDGVRRRARTEQVWRTLLPAAQITGRCS